LRALFVRALLGSAPWALLARALARRALARRALALLASFLLASFLLAVALRVLSTAPLSVDQTGSAGRPCADPPSRRGRYQSAGLVL
jgi:hypothetical protein